MPRCRQNREFDPRPLFPPGGSATIGANFLLVRLAMPATQLGPVVAQLLAGHAIYVKDISPKFGDGRAWLRLAVRTSAENERFVRALAAVCAR